MVEVPRTVRDAAAQAVIRTPQSPKQGDDVTLSREPTLIIQAIVAALTAVQVAAIPMSVTAHTIIAIAVIALGAVVNRAAVTPAKPR